SALPAVPGDYFISSVFVQVCCQQHVPVVQTRVNHLPLPVLSLPAVHDDLVAVPGLDSAKESIFPQSAHGNLARAASRPRIGVSIYDSCARPPFVFPAAEQVNSQETRRQDIFSAILVPIRDKDPVQYTLKLLRADLSFPRSRA